MSMSNWPSSWPPATGGVGYQYDVMGRLTGATMNSQQVASATYGPAGEMLSLSYGAGTETRT